MVSEKLLRVLRSEPPGPFEGAPSLKVPIHYVDGNADWLIRQAGHFHIRVHGRSFFHGGSSFDLVSDNDGRATLKERENEILLLRQNLIPNPKDDAPDLSGNGIYRRLLTEPSWGYHSVQDGKQRIGIFGLPYGEKTVTTKHADILLSHVPPFGKLDLSGGGYGFFRKGEHIGSKQTLAYVREHQPRFCISGHVDMWGGEWAKIGRTVVINVAQSRRDDDRAKYAVIDTKNWTFEIGHHERRSLRRIAGLSSVRTALRTRQITFGNDEMRTINIAKRHGLDVKKIKARIASRTWKAPRIIKPLRGVDEHTAFVDIETGLAFGRRPGRLWLVGILHQGVLKQFEIPSDTNALIAFLRQRKIRVLASWTRYDHEPMYDVLGASAGKIKIIDLCQRSRNSVIWWTYGLHELYEAFFGIESAATELLPGGIAGLLADHKIIDGSACRSCPSKTEIIRKVKHRNKSDLLCMAKLSQLFCQGPSGKP
ncbi:MAG: hypothetical protein HYX59_14125 [Elusimicrobia bacterium]|nr:hypothetical protein [Elusimicrobiota bacterium]